MKIILIPDCRHCPNGARYNLEDTEYICTGSRDPIKVTLESSAKIPDWCPLDDAEKKIMSIMKATAGLANLRNIVRITDKKGPLY